jgi:hypothetical protein
MTAPEPTSPIASHTPPSACQTCDQIVSRFAGAGIRPVRVAIRCRRCGTVHRHHGAPEALPKTRRTAKAAAALAREAAFERLLAVTSGRKSRPYSLSGAFKPNDVIEHPTFGLGVVTQLVADNKIQVAFKNGDKLLACRR